MDTKARTVVKTLTFKLLTTSVTWLITHDLGKAFIIHCFMTLCFIVHERLWNNVKWGRKTTQDKAPTPSIARQQAMSRYPVTDTLGAF